MSFDAKLLLQESKEAKRYFPFAKSALGRAHRNIEKPIKENPKCPIISFLLQKRRARLSHSWPKLLALKKFIMNSFLFGGIRRRMFKYPNTISIIGFLYISM